jgi:multiple sugar transport system substrate-binding protein
VSSNHGVEDNRRQPRGLRLRLTQTATVVSVTALALAASWPALGVFYAELRGKPTASAGAAPTSAPPAIRVPRAEPSGAGPVTLTLLAPTYGPTIDGPFWAAVTADFHAENPDIFVNINLVDRSHLLAEAAAQLNAPDVPDLLLGVVPDDVRSAALDDRFYTADDILGPTLDLIDHLTYREQAGPAPYGTPVGIPFSASLLELYYNKRLFSRAHIAGPPTTWDEIATDAAKIKALGKTGYGLAMGAADAAATAQLWMAGNLGGLMDLTQTDWTVNSRENVATFRWLRDNLVGPGRTEAHPGTHSTRDLEKDFAAGNLGMLVADTRLIAQTKAGALGTAFGVTPIPVREGDAWIKSLGTASLGSVDDLLATKAHPEHKTAIGRLVNFLLSPKYQERFANLNGTLAVTKDASAVQRRDPLLKPFIDGTRLLDWLPYRDHAWPAVQRRIRSDLASALTGDPQAVLDRIQAVATSAQ